MRITNLPSGALQANTYLAVDEKTNEGFIVDPGGYNKVLTKEVRDNDVNIKYIIPVSYTHLWRLRCHGSKDGPQRRGTAEGYGADAGCHRRESKPDGSCGTCSYY